MMKKAILSAMLAGSLLVTAGVPLDFSAGAAATVTLSPYSTYEINDGVFEGWGTSLCWWANRVGYSDTLSQKAADLFYGDEGLRMNIARFNIGGGDDPSHTHITRTDSNMPGYTKYQNGSVTYDWSADANQRNVLQKAIAAAGDNMIVEMFSNSPPYYMTNSGCSTGSVGAGTNNLKDDCYDDFAEYLAEVCAHYENEWGIQIQSIDPMNEPYTNFWGAYSQKQEGCHFDIGASQTNMFLQLQKSLRTRNLNDIMLCGTDETSTDTQIDAFKAMSQDAKDALSRIDTHTYGGSKRAELKNLALAHGKNLWMSEVDGSGVAGKDAGEMGAGLWLAERMALDCNNLHCSAWILWQAIDNHISSVGYNGNKDKGMPNTSGGFWGLAVADHDKNEIVLTKKYYAFGQFSRYIRPGFTMLNTSGNTVAGYDKENGQLVIVATNTSGSASEVNYDLSQFASVGETAQVIRTSGSMQNGENWKDVGDITTSVDGFTASLAPNSVTTFILDGMQASAFDAEKIEITKDMTSGSAAWKDSENDYAKAFDGSTATFFDGVGDGWVQVDLGQRYDLSAIAFAPRAGYEYRCADGAFYGSADGESWSVLHTIKGSPPSGMQFTTKLTDSAGVRYVRYQVPSGAPQTDVNKDSVYCCNIAEIALYGTPADTAVYGDINGDGACGIADVIALQRWLVRDGITLADPAAADLDGDGALTGFDLRILKEFLLYKA